MHLSHRRQLSGLALALAGLPLLTLVLDGATNALSLEGEVLLYLLAVVLIAIIGGVAVALASAVAGALPLNHLLLQPRPPPHLAAPRPARSPGGFRLLAP